MSDDMAGLKKAPTIASTHLYEPYETEVRKEKKLRITKLQPGDRIVCQKTETAWTIAFTRNHTYLLMDDSSSPDDKLLVPAGMDVPQLVAIICMASGLSVVPVDGTSARYMIWQL